MFDYRTILILLFGVVLIVGRKDTANKLFKHYAPLLGNNRRLLPLFSFLSVIIALIFFAFGFFLTSFNVKNPDYILSKNFVFGMILTAGVIYILWSIPGYYRWKKTKKGIELGLFLTKLVIGILTIIGVIVGYTLGKI